MKSVNFIESQRSQDDFDTDLKDDDTNRSRWYSFKLDFFDSFYNDEFTFMSKSIKHTDKNIYFKDVHVFETRIKNLVHVKKSQLIQDNLWTCLHEDTLTWYMTILTNVEKRLLIYDTDVNEWIKTLTRRFQELFITAIIIILKSKYIMKDARSHREFKKYAQMMIQVVKSASLEIIQSQFLIIYNELNVKFQRNMFMFIFIIDLDTFLHELNFCQNRA